MHDHRTDRVYLSADKARCEPAGECPQREKCARWRAAVPRYGSMIGHDLPLWSGHCYYFVSVEAQHGAGPIPPKRAAREAPEGLR